MIEFYPENGFELKQPKAHRLWLEEVILSEGKDFGDINYIFCDDDYLHELNVKYLNHDTYTDVIGFDNSIGNLLEGDIFISTERVQENAQKFQNQFVEELRRVLCHGLLHFCGYKDKSSKDVKLMREKENEKLNMFHVEH